MRGAWLLALGLPIVAGATAIGVVLASGRRRGAQLGEVQRRDCPYCGHEIVCEVSPNICNSYEAHAQVMQRLGKRRGARQESIWLAGLDARNRIILFKEVSKGGLTGAVVHPRDFFLPAVTKRVAAVIMIHNHPSGDPAPSHEDELLTERLVEAGKILGMPVLDHLVVAKIGYYSFRDNGRIKA